MQQRQGKHAHAFNTQVSHVVHTHHDNNNNNNRARCHRPSRHTHPNPGRHRHAAADSAGSSPRRGENTGRWHKHHACCLQTTPYQPRYIVSTILPRYWGIIPLQSTTSKPAQLTARCLLRALTHSKNAEERYRDVVKIECSFYIQTPLVCDICRTR